MTDKGNLKEKISKSPNLPTLPMIALEIINLIRKDDCSVSQIRRVIEKDPPVAARVLKVANSGYYAIRDQVNSLDLAIVIIGLRDLLHIAIGVGIMKNITSTPGNVTIDWRDFWGHSNMVAILSQELTILLNLKNKVSASPYATGLLHDIGKLALNSVLPDWAEDVYMTAIENNIPIENVEIEKLGAGHSEVGGWLCEKWNIPESMINAVKNHHYPGRITEENGLILAGIVHCADYISNRMGYRFGNDEKAHPDVEESVWSTLNNESVAYKNSGFNDLLEYMLPQQVEFQRKADRIWS